jgi:hypothetical protein
MAMAAGAYGQCVYTTGKIPQGTIAVFRNGEILRQGPDFTVKGRVITPISFAPADKFSALFSVQISLNLPDGTPYISYRNWIESWDCPGLPQTSPSLQLLETCSGSGVSPPGSFPVWDATATYPAGYYVNFGSVSSWLSLQASNLGNQPDISGAWWKALTWDCTGMLRATIKLSDGSTLVLTGVSGAASGSQVTWTPVK